MMILMPKVRILKMICLRLMENGSTFQRIKQNHKFLKERQMKIKNVEKYCEQYFFVRFYQCEDFMDLNKWKLPVKQMFETNTGWSRFSIFIYTRKKNELSQAMFPFLANCAKIFRLPTTRPNPKHFQKVQISRLIHSSFHQSNVHKSVLVILLYFLDLYLIKLRELFECSTIKPLIELKSKC